MEINKFTCYQKSIVTRQPQSTGLPLSNTLPKLLVAGNCSNSLTRFRLARHVLQETPAGVCTYQARLYARAHRDSRRESVRINYDYMHGLIDTPAGVYTYQVDYMHGLIDTPAGVCTYQA